MKSNCVRFLSLAFFLLAGSTFELPNDFLVHSQVKLDDAQRALIESSRKAIVATGLSESYVDSHFTLLKVFNQPADQRVVWKFVVNGYEAIINDSIGSTLVGSKQMNIHSVGRTLGHATEITKTISRPRALRALKSCIGNYSEPYVEFGQVNGRAELFLVGTQKSKVSQRKRTEEMEEEREEAAKRSRKNSGTDEIESEEGERKETPVILGYINLQTGRCTKGKGVSAKENL